MMAAYTTGKKVADAVCLLWGNKDLIMDTAKNLLKLGKQLGKLAANFIESPAAKAALQEAKKYTDTAKRVGEKFAKEAKKVVKEAEKAAKAAADAVKNAAKKAV